MLSRLGCHHSTIPNGRPQNNGCTHFKRMIIFFRASILVSGTFKCMSEVVAARIGCTQVVQGDGAGKLKNKIRKKQKCNQTGWRLTSCKCDTRMELGFPALCLAIVCKPNRISSMIVFSHESSRDNIVRSQA